MAFHSPLMSPLPTSSLAFQGDDFKSLSPDRSHVLSNDWHDPVTHHGSKPPGEDPHGLFSDPESLPSFHSAHQEHEDDDSTWTTVSRKKRPTKRIKVEPPDSPTIIQARTPSHNENRRPPSILRVPTFGNAATTATSPTTSPTSDAISAIPTAQVCNYTATTLSPDAPDDSPPFDDDLSSASESTVSETSDPLPPLSTHQCTSGLGSNLRLMKSHELLLQLINSTFYFILSF